MEPNKTTNKSPRKRTSQRKARVTKLHSENRWDLPKPLLAIFDEHKYVSKLVRLLEAEAAKLKQNRKADYDCMEDIMHYMIHFPDRYHHPKEDLIFERMSGLDQKTEKTVAKLQRDHKKLAEQGQTLHEKIIAQNKSHNKVKALNLADEIAFYARAFRKHMSLEETAVFEPARTSLKETDWQEIDKAIKSIVDPVFGEKKSERYLDLVQRYINDFISISSSGSVPVRAVESTVSKVEQAVYTVAEMRHLPKKLVNTNSEIVKDRFKHLGDLSTVRDYAGLQAWLDDGKTANKDDWSRIVDEVKNTLDSVSQPLDIDEMHSGLATIKLRTEKEMFSFHEKPYKPSKNPRISWQAALMNLLTRVTLKQMMGHMNLEGAEKSDLFKKPSESVPPGTRVEPVKEVSFHADWLLPEELAPTTRTILHLPGGGFFAPASGMHRTMLARLASRVQSRAMLVNYRLLPEHPFPAGLEDALAAYHYLLDEGVRPEEIVISGDSAGGTLTLAMMLALRDEGSPLPAAAALLSPLTDLTFSTAARETNRWKDPLLPTKRKMDAYKQYSGEVPADNPLVSPIYGNFEGFPPMFALVSSTETLLDDTLIVARKARSQGVDFEVEVWENLPHAWPIFSFMPEAGVAVERLGEFFVHHLNAAQDSTPRTLLERAS